ncbi:TauD/TfdA family dioxygenase [uncultured Erythrobacter sp.]|uniref:TauD/TfdA dioxygenase family protein n=1 Tax=uncultured Erythrobacter sp. TaxID=263913 RepID=UPI00262B0C74|nr:TauD/TfdA family dioxygenase [uncultured Erythrobacter sp.]
MKASDWSQSCGSLIEGVQLADASDSEIYQMRQLLARRGVLFFRDQDFAPAAHLAFAKSFGDLVLNKFFMPVEGFHEIAEVRKEANQTTNIGGGWHTDHSYDVAPALGSILVARELPTKGGDTLFANMHAAWSALPDPLKQRAKQLTAVHSNAHIYGRDGYYSRTDLASSLKGSDDVGSATHPVMVRHPQTGAEILYVNPAHTIALEGLAREESEEFLRVLFHHAQQPQFQCRFNWQPGSVAIWDNRLTWHLAENDYDGERRLMHRITLAGEPFPLPT